MQNPPFKENGYYEIRLESIGGLGANLCGKMLGDLGALKLDLNASGFSSYGSEKRGSPVKSYIRWCPKDMPIRNNSPVRSPDLLCIFHEGLLGKHPVTEGIHPRTQTIVNTSKTPEEISRLYDFSPSTLYCIDAQKIAMDTHSRINMVLLGAMVRAADFIPLAKVAALCKETFRAKDARLVQTNIDGLHRGYEALSKGYPCNADGQPPREEKTGEAYMWGYDTAPVGGINTRPGSTVSNDLSPSREGFIPLFLPEKCINCGLCDSTCPDMVFQFMPGSYRGTECMVNCGLDYLHCKGCLRCVEVCPTGALVKAQERDYPVKPHFLPDQSLLPDHVAYEKSGPSSWITSDSFFPEKPVEGGTL